MARRRVQDLLETAVITRFELGGEAYIVAATPVVPAERSRLTRTEAPLARALARGLTNAAIAGARGVSVRTVANQLAALYRKLGVASRREAVLHLYRDV